MFFVDIMLIILFVVLLQSFILGYKFIVSIIIVFLVRINLGINLDILLGGKYFVMEEEC